MFAFVKIGKFTKPFTMHMHVSKTLSELPTQRLEVILLRLHTLGLSYSFITRSAMFDVYPYVSRSFEKYKHG